jgi:hypothetical protein
MTAQTGVIDSQQLNTAHLDPVFYEKLWVLRIGLNKGLTHTPEEARFR